MSDFDLKKVKILQKPKTKFDWYDNEEIKNGISIGVQRRICGDIVQPAEVVTLSATMVNSLNSKELSELFSRIKKEIAEFELED